MNGLLSAEDEAIVRAEQRGADFGLLVEIGTGSTERIELERTLGVVIGHWPSLGARVVRDGASLTVAHDRPQSVRELEHAADLRGLIVLASRGERLLRYSFRRAAALQLLGHHVVLDAGPLDTGALGPRRRARWAGAARVCRVAVGAGRRGPRRS